MIIQLILILRGIHPIVSRRVVFLFFKPKNIQQIWLLDKKSGDNGSVSNHLFSSDQDRDPD